MEHDTLGVVERNRSELADFLATRRARLSPADVGLGDVDRRRVPGLRREELAQLAGVSVDYYTRLEQGRSRSASVEVLDALATALQLDDAEREHLHQLGRPRPARRTVKPRPQRVRPETLDLLERLDLVFSPAFILGRRLDVLAHNRLAGALIAEFRSMPAPQRNQARFVFLEPHARELYADWRQVAVDTVGMLRHEAGRHPDDPKLSTLVGELSIHSDEFRTWWSRHDVQRRTTGTKSYHHPVVGDVTVTYQALHPSGDEDQVVIVYTAEPGSSSDTALRLLANWHQDRTHESVAGPSAEEPTDAR